MENQAEKPTIKKEKPKTISSNRASLLHFKTALRNHINLSAVADRKANIMLSVNALIVTVALPILINYMQSIPNLQIPTIILAIVGLSSMLFATLSTRPISMPGRTSVEDIDNNKSNLFFFGNFHKMDYEEYEAGVKKVIASSEMVDQSVIRDLFFSGKAVGRKFDYLRICYNLFMYGMILVVLSYLIVSFLN